MQQGISESGGGTTQARPVSSSSSGTAPKSSGSGKRYVRTAAGAARYKKPIGSEIIATPRDQRGARAQTDRESTDRYKGLISTDPDTQRKAMAGLSDDQLKRLSEVAFSFGSNDPSVARLRAGIALEMRGRGLDVNRYGGLAGRDKAGAASRSGGSVTAINFQTGERYQVAVKASSAQRKAASASDADERRALGEAVRQETKRRQIAAKAERDRLAAAKKLQAQQAAAARQQQAEQARLERAKKVTANRPANAYRSSTRRSGKHSRAVQLSTLDLAEVSTEQRQQAEKKGQALPGGRFPIRNVADLRAAIHAFGRTKPEDREKVARFICKRAKALNAEHMLGDGIRKAAGYSTGTDLSRTDPIVVDLAGKWKHGWIPLDATAVGAKTHGRQGAKPWWTSDAKGHHAEPGKSGGGKGSDSTVSRLAALRRKPGESDQEYRKRLRESGATVTNVSHPGPEPQGPEQNRDYAILRGNQRDKYKAARSSGKTHKQAMDAAHNPESRARALDNLGGAGRTTQPLQRGVSKAEADRVLGNTPDAKTERAVAKHLSGRNLPIRSTSRSEAVKNRDPGGFLKAHGLTGTGSGHPTREQEKAGRVALAKKLGIKPNELEDSGNLFYTHRVTGDQYIPHASGGWFEVSKKRTETPGGGQGKA